MKTQAGARKMQKSKYLQQKKLNAADELREMLSSIEDRLVNIKSMNPTQALILLRDLDLIYSLFSQLERTELNLVPEQGRFKVNQARLMKTAVPFLKALGGPVALSRHRPLPTPPREQWWWYIHEIVALQKQQLLRRLVMGVVIVLIVVGGAILAFNTILAPSPEVVARLEAENAAFEAIGTGDYRAALTILDEGLLAVPADPDLMLLKGVVYEILGQEAKASQSFADVQASMNDPLAFLLDRGQLELHTNQPDRVERDARAALEIDEDSASAWLLLGQALESQGRSFEAMPAYERAGQLALDNGESQIAVMARMALGRLSASR
jgi:tetratricopeptide (TPR) repeat protein